MTVGSLFAGIGGFDLGFERAGFDVIWQCEKDEYCQKVLNKHWPDIPVYNDVQTLYTDDGPHPERPEVLIGGFPCQDISLAGKGRGLNGERSGLWWEYHRIISVVRPRYAVLENVAALVNRGLPAICGALSEIGYDAEWEIVSAAACGAPHLRERLFIVAYPSSKRRRENARCTRSNEKANGRRSAQDHEFASYGESHKSREVSRDVADTNGTGCQKLNATTVAERPRLNTWSSLAERASERWAAEPDVGRLAHGVSNRVDRLRGFGNAIVPQVAEYVAHCVRQHASRTHAVAEP